MHSVRDVLPFVLVVGVFMFGVRGVMMWDSRRMVRRGRDAWPTALAVATGWVEVVVQSRDGNPSARLRRATLVLLPDRLMAQPRRAPAVDVPLSSVTAASWRRDVVNRSRVAVLTLGRAAGTPAAEVALDNLLGTETATFATAVNDVLARWLPAGAGPGEPPRFLTSTGGRRFLVAWGNASLVGVLAVAGVLIADVLGPAVATSADRAITGAPGYYTMHGSHGKPLAVGAPWGTPCTPVVVVATTLPEPVYRAIAGVVRQAHARGVEVLMARRDGTIPLTRLSTGTGPQARPHGLNVYDAATVADAPSVDHVRLGWNASLAPDGKHEYLTYEDALLNLANLHDPVMLRKAARMAVGYSQGIAASTVPGSAFGEHLADAADRFSSSDIHAMLTMSGCAPYVPGG